MRLIAALTVGSLTTASHADTTARCGAACKGKIADRGRNMSGVLDIPRKQLQRATAAPPIRGNCDEVE